MKSLILKHQESKQSIPVIYLILPIVMFSLFLSSNSSALEGDELFVIESLIHVRSGPSNDSESILKLKKDRKVIEIQRQNDWVEVELHRDDVKTGWIYKTLLSKATTENTSLPTRFDIFMQRFNNHTRFIKKENGIVYFIRSKRQRQRPVRGYCNSSMVKQ